MLPLLSSSKMYLFVYAFKRHEKRVLRILLRVIIIENRRILENGTNGNFK